LRSLEDASNAEEEPAATIITDGACEFDRPEDGIHDDPGRAIQGEIRRLRTESQLVRLAHLGQPNELDVTAQQWGEFGEFADIPQLPQELLVGI
jgi:hypothetical protein